MFERYTEKARRVIFFARYEASQFGSPYIETEHLLLGLMREESGLLRRLVPKLDYQTVGKKIENQTLKREFIPASVDLPLSNESRRVLVYAAEEAERLNHRHIGSEHLLLALLRESEAFAAQILKEGDAKLEELRHHIAKHARDLAASLGTSYVAAKSARPQFSDTVELHGVRRRIDSVQQVVKTLRGTSWYWEKCSWKPRDIVISCKGGAVSFDLSLAKDVENFQLVKAGWKRDCCVVCQWELFETEEVAHGEGYTNGREWLCAECHHKFFEGPDFFRSAYAEIT